MRWWKGLCGSEAMSAGKQFIFSRKDEREAEWSCGETLEALHEAHFYKGNPPPKGSGILIGVSLSAANVCFQVCRISFFNVRHNVIASKSIRPASAAPARPGAPHHSVPPGRSLVTVNWVCTTLFQTQVLNALQT